MDDAILETQAVLIGQGSGLHRADMLFLRHLTAKLRLAFHERRSAARLASAAACASAALLASAARRASSGAGVPPGARLPRPGVAPFLGGLCCGLCRRGAALASAAASASAAAWASAAAVASAAALSSAAAACAARASSAALASAAARAWAAAAALASSAACSTRESTNTASIGGDARPARGASVEKSHQRGQDERGRDHAVQQQGQNSEPEYSRRPPDIYCAPAAEPLCSLRAGGNARSGSVRKPSLVAPARCISIMARITTP